MKNISRKLCLAALTLGLSVSQVSAQVVDKGSSHINVGYVFPDYIDAFVGSFLPVSTVGPFTASYQYAFRNKLAIGIEFEYLQGKTPTFVYKDQTTGLDYNYSAKYGCISIMAKADYHYLNHNKLDLYSGLSAGLGIGTATVLDHDKKSTSASLDLFMMHVRLAGVRYMVTDHIGAFAEGGVFSAIVVNTPSFSAGISAKFGGTSHKK